MSDESAPAAVLPPRHLGGGQAVGGALAESPLPQAQGFQVNLERAPKVMRSNF